MKQEELHFQTIVLWILDLIAVAIAVRVSVRLFHLVPETVVYEEWEHTLVYVSCLLYSFAFFWNIDTSLSSDDTVKEGMKNVLWKHVFLLISVFVFILFTGNTGKRPLLSLFISFFSYLFILLIRLMYRLFIEKVYRRKGFGMQTVLVTERKHLSAALRTFSSLDAFQMHLKGILVVDPAAGDEEKWKDGIETADGRKIPRIEPDGLEDYILVEPVGCVIFDVSRATMKKMKEEIDMVRGDGIGVVLRAQQEAQDALDAGGRYGKISRKNFLFLNSRHLRERTQCIKRAVDLIVGLIGSLIAALAAMLIAPFIKLGSRGPLFKRVTCIGKDGKRFQLLTFRTSYTGPELKKTLLSRRNSAFGGTQAEDKAPSSTSVGRIIEILHLTGLPKFFSVLKGDMSLIGVNTITEEEYTGYEHAYRKCLRCKPGLICPPGVQPVSESENTDGSSIAPDVAYAQNWSLWLDIVTIFDNFRSKYEHSQNRPVE